MKILTAAIAAALCAIAAPVLADPVPYGDMHKEHAEQRMERHMEHHHMMMRHHMRHRMMMRHHHRMMHDHMEHHDDAH